MASNSVAETATAAQTPVRAVVRALVRAEDLSIGYGNTIVQHDLNFEILAGEVLVICGGSGSGKSTLLRCLIGLQEPIQGRVLFGDRDLYTSDAATLAALRREFGVSFQAGALWTSMTVGENVMLPLQLFTDMNAAQREQEARFKLALVGLEDSFDREPSALSGGMKKRAAIARALALNPALVFLDEPSAGLDPLSSADLDELILHLCRDLGTTVVMVSHELESIFSVADRVLLLDASKQTMTALGPPRALQASDDPYAQAFFQRRSAEQTA
jgi:phospholipid/cholesterol/gamma-HCH transport system ATP-binding protein